MARQNINLGTNLNDGTGDKLRDAMKKANDNFIELYAASPASGSVQIENAIISSTDINNANITIKPIAEGDVNITNGLNVNTDRNAHPFRVYSNDESRTQPLFHVNTANNLAILDGDFSTTNLLVSNNTTLSGNIQLGTTSANTIIVNGRLQGELVPNFDAVVNLGLPNKNFLNGYISNITSSSLSSVDIDSTNANVTILRVSQDSFIGDLLIRQNMISNRVPNDNIEIRPDGTGNVYITTKLIVGAGSTPMVNPVLQATGDADNFTQIGVQNKNTGKFACSDIVVFTNEGSDFFDFVDIGQNNSGWDGSLQYVYFDKGGNADTWGVTNTVHQIDPADGSSILARGQIDEKVTNPLNSNEWRFRVCNIFEGTTGLFDQGSIAGLVYNETLSSSDTPKEHLVETITSNGSKVYNLGTHTLSSSTARAAFAPTVILANDSCVVKVNGTTQRPGVDYTIQFNKISFYNIPAVGTTITIRQFPDANYPFTVGQSGDSYVYNNGKKLTIGTMTGDDVLFHVNGVRYTSESARIKGPSKNWIFAHGVTDKDGFSDTGEKVQIHGDLRLNGNIVMQNRTIATSIGSEDDKAGMIAVDNDYIYRCIANYDGSTNIWKRTPLSGSAW